MPSLKSLTVSILTGMVGAYILQKLQAAGVV